MNLVIGTLLTWLALNVLGVAAFHRYIAPRLWSRGQ